MALLSLLHGLLTTSQDSSGGDDGGILPIRRDIPDACLVGALTVDHALRPESRAEAEGVAEYCSKKLHLPHFIYTIRWPPEAILSHTGKPSLSVLQAEARRRRYEMLAKACAEHHASHIFLAHTADDQAETLLLRWGRASGLHGLGGMAPASQRVIPLPLTQESKDAVGNSRQHVSVWLCRPLLGFSKAQLIATCEARHVPFVTDPSNVNTVFDRVRVRQALQQIASAAQQPAAEGGTAPGNSPGASTKGALSVEDALALSAASLAGVCERAARAAAELDSRGEDVGCRTSGAQPTSACDMPLSCGILTCYALPCHFSPCYSLPRLLTLFQDLLL